MLVIRGRAHGLSGARGRARKALLAAVREARALGTPLYEAMAHFELGRGSPIGGAEHRERFEAARRLWSAAGAAHHLARLDAIEGAER